MKSRSVCIGLLFVLPTTVLYNTMMSFMWGSLIPQYIIPTPNPHPSVRLPSVIVKQPEVAVFSTMTFVHDSTEFDSIHICVIKSAARLHPSKTVLVFTNVSKKPKAWSKYKNIKLNKLDYKEIFKSTPLATWYSSRDSFSMVKNKTNLISIAARYAIMLKHPGVHLETDVLCVRPLESHVVTAVSTDSDDGNSLSATVVYSFPSDALALTLLQHFSKQVKTCVKNAAFSRCLTGRFISETLDYGEKARDRSIVVLPLMSFHGLTQLSLSVHEALYTMDGLHAVKTLIKDNENVHGLHLNRETVHLGSTSAAANGSFMNLVCVRDESVESMLL